MFLWKGEHTRAFRSSALNGDDARAAVTSTAMVQGALILTIIGAYSSKTSDVLILLFKFLICSMIMY